MTLQESEKTPIDSLPRYELRKWCPIRGDIHIQFGEDVSALLRECAKHNNQREEGNGEYFYVLLTSDPKQFGSDQKRRNLN